MRVLGLHFKPLCPPIHNQTSIKRERNNGARIKECVRLIFRLTIPPVSAAFTTSWQRRVLRYKDALSIIVGGRAGGAQHSR